MGAASSWGGVRPKRYSVQRDPDAALSCFWHGRVHRGHAQIKKGVIL